VDHYFSAQPASAGQRREITVTLAGREVTVETAGGIFSPDHVDLGTQVLLKHVPPPAAHGTLLDLGCGWGPIALTAALMCPTTRVVAVDVNERALDLLRHNAQRVRSNGAGPIEALTPDAVPAQLRFDSIWSNPPIRIGKNALHELLATWLPRLTPAGEAFLVVQRNLGADSLATWIAAQGWGEVAKVASSKGFRVLRLTAVP